MKLGEKKTLDCNIEGHPVIKHTWYKGGKKLSESKTLRVHVDKKDKFGNYTCLGKNSAGEEVILFSLQEQGKLVLQIFLYLKFMYFILRKWHTCVCTFVSSSKSKAE